MGAPGVEQKPWTPSDDELLRELVAAKKTASQIAPFFGRTRNAVIGRIDRLGLSLWRAGKYKPRGKQSAPKRVPPQGEPRLTKQPVSRLSVESDTSIHVRRYSSHALDTGAGEASPLCPPAPVPFSPRWPVPWIDSTGCQFPVDVRGHVEPGQHMNMLVCDEPNIPGKRWCQHHFRAFFYKSDKRLRAVA